MPYREVGIGPLMSANTVRRILAAVGYYQRKAYTVFHLTATHRAARLKCQLVRFRVVKSHLVRQDICCGREQCRAGFCDREGQQKILWWLCYQEIQAIIILDNSVGVYYKGTEEPFGDFELFRWQGRGDKCYTILRAGAWASFAWFIYANVRREEPSCILADRCWYSYCWHSSTMA